MSLAIPRTTTIEPASDAPDPRFLPHTRTISTTDVDTLVPTPMTKGPGKDAEVDIVGASYKLEKATAGATPTQSSSATDPEACTSDSDDAPRKKLSQGLKWTLLFIFALAMFIDILFYSAFFVFMDLISHDLHIDFAQQSWVITAYSVTFAAFLLFWGRVSDLYSPSQVFSWGFVALGVLSLVTSFLPDKYSFFIVRALAGISGASLIPASYRLIVFVFEPHEQPRAFTLYGISGAIANVTGIIIAGVINLIPGGGQMRSWRWFFRIVSMIILPIAASSFYLIPASTGKDAKKTKQKWRRLDLVGVFLMLVAIVLLILGLTLGASYGWKKPGFLVPFLLSFALFPAFFYWESRLDDDMALIPTKTWKIPNMVVLTIFALQIYAWWAVNYLAHVQVYTIVYHESAILAAVRVLPEGVSATAVTLLLMFFPRLVSVRPRYTILIGTALGAVGCALMAQPNNWQKDYWRYLFAGFILGSGGTMASFTGVNVGVMTAVPPEMAGVAGAILQVSFQMGTAVGFSVQSGLLTIKPGGLTNPTNVHASFYFQLGWAALWFLGFAVLYRPSKSGSDEENRKVDAE
ncbi:putative MFS-type transporterc [Vanrija pseudolonga]|uniref:Purtative MFS-type transporterc n=1 Tax=Vanrija pseudolonga TaxID=143232 RepID=A0AAF0YJR8_9TREE|nr:purtative MFS-type transporterc [Vanrija pseudolonga]